MFILEYQQGSLVRPQKAKRQLEYSLTNIRPCPRIKPYNPDILYVLNGGNEMALVKKTIELDQDQINRIKTALKAKSEKEAINAVMKQFDTDFQLAEATLKDAGSFDFEEV